MLVDRAIGDAIETRVDPFSGAWDASVNFDEADNQLFVQFKGKLEDINLQRIANGEAALNIDIPENHEIGHFDMRSIEVDISNFIDTAGAQDMKNNKDYWVQKISNGLRGAISVTPPFVEGGTNE